MKCKPNKPSATTQALWIASMMAITAGIVAFAVRNGFIENHSITRFVGIAFGFILVVTANFFPKQLFPHNTAKAHRRISWLFAIAGLLYVVVWITGVTQSTEPIFALMFAPACMLSMLLYRYANPRPSSEPSAQPTSGPSCDETSDTGSLDPHHRRACCADSTSPDSR